ncbi:MAG: hypothetical protein B7O98_04190 [Zestosphaera tikiterensis]|uniref:Uncharacterized protein n=1 Tax=Zestosphaera tikiterensis TaxID=1973259 RepID=A0A2R7Y7V4_9CREN|nr:MAG: hypothetical protein B7O98_04190 [Zestosphaera tikiterensis]
MKCFQCLHFKPSETYPKLGVCGLSNEAVLGVGEACEKVSSKFEVLRDKLKRDGWLYCVSCRKLITTEDELLEHLDEVSADFLIDEFAWEDLPASD